MTDDERRLKAEGMSAADVAAVIERLEDPADGLGDWGGRGYALEYTFLRAFLLEGGAALSHRWPYRVSDSGLALGVLEQVDGAVHFDFASVLLEAKCLKDPVDVEPLAKLRLRLERRPPGTLGFLLSWSGFTAPARFFANYSSPLNVILWSGEDLRAAIPGRMLESARLKWRTAIEQADAVTDLATAFTVS